VRPVARRDHRAELADGTALRTAARLVGTARRRHRRCYIRDPDREIDRDPHVAYAAADGTIKTVDRIRDPWMAGETLRIGTCLSLADVHVSRRPVAGTLANVETIQAAPCRRS
jgi:hypothetical protein